MKAYQVRNIVNCNFNAAYDSIDVVNRRNGKDSRVFLNAEGVQGMLLMIERAIVDDINDLEDREVDEVVKEVVG